MPPGKKPNKTLACVFAGAGNVGKGQSSGINNILAATREYHGTFRSPSLASRTKMAPAETPDVIMTLVSYCCGLPGVPRKARKHWHYRAGFALKVTICRNIHSLPKHTLLADAAR